MATKGNILKDSFYKERLARTSKHLINGYTTTNFISPAQEESDTDTAVISSEEQQLDFKEHLSNFGKTSEGSTFAFRSLVCTGKRLPAVRKIAEYKFLEKVDLSFNNLRSLKHLTGLKYLTEIRATNNMLSSVLEMKEIPLHLDSVDLSSNRITAIPDLGKHKLLRVLKLSANKISAIGGLSKNRNLRVLDLSQNVLQEIQGLDGLQLTQLYLNNNQIQTVKGLSKLEQLRILNLSINRIKKLSGLVNLVSLRQLNLAKNGVKHVRQIDFLQNLMYLDQLDLCYNPLQERKYYRLQVIYKLPMLRLLDGTPLSGEEGVRAESLYGLDVEEKYNIFKKHLAEEEFIDRRIHKSELVEAETDSDGGDNHLVDEYDEEGRRSNSRSKNSKGFNASKRSNFSKNSKASKRSSFSKN